VWTTSASAAGHGFHVFDQLYGLDADLNPKPQMAEGSTVSDDKLTWTITLRDGLKFHDGENVLSRDCIASLKRWGVRDTLGQSLVAAVDQWKVVDDKTFSISLKSPFPMMLYALGKPATSVPFIMPERLANTDAAKQVTEMIGSGPYRFVADEFISGSMAAYRKFEGYVPRQEPPVRTSGGKVAYFDRVEWQAIPDAATVAAALKRGEVDWWEQVLSDMVPVLKSDRNIRVSNGDPNGYVGLLRFNSLQPPFNNPKLRQAVLSAVRQSDYMEAITGNDRTAYQHCHSFLPCGTPYAQTPKTDRLSDDPDLARARELVKASGYAGEKVVIINPTDFPSIQPMGQITAALCRSLGLNVELVETDWGSVLQRRGSREATDKGGWSIFHTWWQAIGITTPATNAYMRGQGSTGWFGWYQNDRIESLTKEWISAVSDADRLRISNDIQDLVAIDAPSVPLGLFQIRSAYRSDITGIVEGVAPFPWNVRRT
jgi:peptide/nickel transport system substrate-binding protein